MAIKDYLNDYRHPKVPSGHFPIEPKETAEIEYIYQSMLNANKMVLLTGGEKCSLYRRKTTGIRCINPVCPAHNNYQQSGSLDCPVCLGSGFVGGYDYIEELFIRFNPQIEKLQLTKDGVLRDITPKIWTMPEPILKQFDILINFYQPQVLQEATKEDVEIERGTSSDLDILETDSNNQVIRILKVSNNAGSSADYKENIDYVVSNNGILWMTTNKPDTDDLYYITYQYTASHYRRYEVNNVTPSRWRGKSLHQELNLTELNITHPAYRITQQPVEQYDITYPFPVSRWFSR